MGEARHEVWVTKRHIDSCWNSKRIKGRGMYEFMEHSTLKLNLFIIYD